MDQDSNPKSSKVSGRIVKRNPKFLDDDSSQSAKKKYRPCEKSTCGLPRPRCCVKISGCCCDDGYTSRWYHISRGEHFCNECFEYYYRTSKDGNKIFESWCTKWGQVGRQNPTIKRFIVDEVLPFWIQCTRPSCRKWREVEDKDLMNPDWIKQFECGHLNQNSDVDDYCAVLEEPAAVEASEPGWIFHLQEEPLLKDSHAVSILKPLVDEEDGSLLNYDTKCSKLDEVGLYPVDTNFSSYPWTQDFHVFEMLSGFSMCELDPLEMSDYEISFMPPNEIVAPVYIGLRNLIISIWYKDPTAWLTLERVSPFVICRGLVRIWLMHKLECVMNFLTREAIVNCGAVSSPLLNVPAVNSQSVIVIGAGIAGIAAARHLCNLGIKVTVLEAGTRIGGRVWKDDVFEKGAQFIRFKNNNPLMTLFRQLNCLPQPSTRKTVFVNKNGLVKKSVVENMQVHFGGMKVGAIEDAVIRNNGEDENWYDVILQSHREFREFKDFTAEEEGLLLPLLRIEEVDLRASLNQLTLVNYEMTRCEEYDFDTDVVIPGGIMTGLEKLANDVDIRLNTRVDSIIKTDDSLKISTNDGNFTAAKVIVTVPLPILRNGEISFDPPLPDWKTKAFHSLEDSIFEKVILQFEERFWNKVLKGNSTRFALFSQDEDLPFVLFQDVTNTTSDSAIVPTLMTFITASSFGFVKGKSESEIVELCLRCLREFFGKSNGSVVPEPIKYAVTNWSSDPNFKTSGSFLKVGSPCTVFDEMAKEIDDCIFFAGEATHRKRSRYLDGAYLSGFREAKKVTNLILPQVGASN